MKVLDSLIERPLPVFLAALLIAVLGVYALLRLPIKRNPSVEIPYALVVAAYEGAAPADVETEVTIELEEELNTLDELRHMRSISRDGTSLHVLEFEDRADMTESARSARDKADLARIDLPKEVEDVVVQELSFDDEPIAFFTFVGSSDSYLLRDLAEELQPRLESVRGVNRVEVFGGYEREVQVRVDPPQLAAYRLTFDDLAAALRRQGHSAPAGRLRAAESDRMIRATGEYRRLEEIGATILANRNGRPVHVRDVARVELRHEELDTGSWYNGESSVTLIVHRQADVNTLETAARLRERVAAYAAQLPPGVRIEVSASAARVIQIMLRQLGTSAALGTVLVLAVLFLMFGLRQAFLVSLALPFSLLFTFVGLLVFGMELSNVTLFGLILVLGMVVDGAIVVGEAIYRERETGCSPIEAARRGLARVGAPVISADLTTIAAFAPMLMMVGIMGQFMSVIPKVVIFALAGSLFVDHLLLPAASARVGARRTQPLRRLAPDGLPWFSPDLPRLRSLYLRTLERALHRRLAIVAGAAVAFALTLGVYVSGAIETIFLPGADRGRFTVNYALPLGSPLEDTDRVGALIQREIAAFPEVNSYVLTTGNTGALNTDPREGGHVGPEYGRINVELSERSERLRSQSEIVNALRGRLEHFAGVEIDVEELSEGPPVGAPLTIRVKGREFGQLETAALAVESTVRRLPNAVDVSTDYDRSAPEVRVEVDRELASSAYGLTPEDVARTVLTAFHGIEVGRMWVGSERVDIRLQADASYGRSIDHVRELGLRASNGAVVPIGEMATVFPSFAAPALYRHDGLRTITVRADAAEGASSVALVEAARAALDALALPPGVELSFGGEFEERDRSNASLLSALKWGLLLIWLVMALQFDSIKQPFLVLFTIPLALVGVTAGLLLTGTPFSFIVFIGIVSLTGIVVNDGIVLVDAINQARREGMPPGNAIRDAGMRRLRPVILTTVTTIFGLLPLTLNLTSGGEFWVPLGITIISGLTVSSALTLVFLPVIYSLLEDPPFGWARERRVDADAEHVPIRG